jgi:hypothetical protein
MRITTRFSGGSLDQRIGELLIPGKFSIGMELKLGEETYVSQDGPAAQFFQKTQREEERLGSDGSRFRRVLSAVVGKRLIYRELTAQGDAGFMGIK